MILGWRSGTSLGRWVLIDPVFPWPALGHGRAALKRWAKWHTRARGVNADEGPMLSPTRWGLTTAAAEADAYTELRVWPVTKDGSPRPWVDRDSVWRESLAEMRRYVGQELPCGIKLLWMPSGTVIRAERAPTLLGQQGFYTWKKGERAPTERRMRELSRGHHMLDAMLRGGRPPQQLGVH